jgi:DNA-binding transcriptional LysR family regulator
MITICFVNISAINLNLLVAFDALVQEENVTRAAQRIGVTQSAVSNSLAQLRRIIADPLFVRRARGVVATERALALAGPVRQALSLLQHALDDGPRFDPATSKRTFVVAASDYVEYVLLPPLLQRLERAAPKVRIEVRPWGLHEVPAGLDTAGLDLMLGFYGGLPPGHHEQRLFDERYVCIVRKGHPHVRGKLTLKRYTELSHVLVSQRAASPGSVDIALARLGKARTVGARVSHFLMVPSLVAKTDFVAALSRRIAEPFARALPLVIHPPPISLPVSTIGQVWHDRTHTDAAHTWFRSVVREVCSTL